MAEELYQAGFISYPRTETDGFSSRTDLHVGNFCLLFQAWIIITVVAIPDGLGEYAVWHGLCGTVAHLHLFGVSYATNERKWGKGIMALKCYS